MLTLALLYMNGKWIDVSPQELYDIAKTVAENSPKAKNWVIEMLTGFFANMKPLN